MTPNIKLQKQLVLLSKILVAGVILLAGFVVIGSMCFFHFMERISPYGITMNPLAAIEYIILGISYLLVVSKTDFPYKSVIINTILLIIISFSLIVLYSYLSGIDIGIDKILCKIEIGSLKLNRMSHFTALCLFLNSLSLWLLQKNDKNKLILSQIIAFIVLFISSFLLYSFLFGSLQLIYLYTDTPTAFFADICHWFLAMAILLAYPDMGFAGEITKTKTGSKIVYLFLPIAITIPIIIGWLSTSNLFIQHAPSVVFIVMLCLGT